MYTHTHTHTHTPTGEGRVSGVVGAASLPTLLALEPALQSLVSGQGVGLLATQLTRLLCYIATLQEGRDTDIPLSQT